MLTDEYREHLSKSVRYLHDKGLYKTESLISSSQGGRIDTVARKGLLNLSANNYLGLANSPILIAAAKQALDCWGYGMASVRFICGTQTIHAELERKLSAFLGMEDTILYSSCFDANTGLFETLLDSEDVILSDELNHASVIDGIRLCKAQRLRYKNHDMADLASKLEKTRGSRFKVIATDGVFSMDGSIANLPEICDLAERHQALVMVDDSHAVGFLGPNGRGSHEYYNVIDRIDILTGTLGKALGGASGGYASGSRGIVDVLRQRSRPYLFSNSLAPSLVATAIAALDFLSADKIMRACLWENTRFFRQLLSEAQLAFPPGEHPIIPWMLGDAVLARQIAARLFELGIYVVSFSYPVVPDGKARIRLQVSTAHSLNDLEFASEQFSKVYAEVAGAA